MKFYKLVCGEDTKHAELYRLLESIGDFIIDDKDILFFSNRIKNKDFANIGASAIEINVIEYRSGNNIANEWLISNYRKFKVEDLLKDAEKEKQEELKNLYCIIKDAEEIIEREGDVVEQK